MEGRASSKSGLELLRLRDLRLKGCARLLGSATVRWLGPVVRIAVDPCLPWSRFLSRRHRSIGDFADK